MMDPAERHDGFIADLLAKRARLRKAKMVRIGWLPSAQQASLLRHEPEMLFVAITTWFGERKNTLVHALARCGIGPVVRPPPAPLSYGPQDGRRTLVV